MLKLLPSCLVAGLVLVLLSLAIRTDASFLTETERALQESEQLEAKYLQGLQSVQNAQVYQEGATATDNMDENNQDCFRTKREFNSRVHKKKYRIGVHSIRGLNVTELYYNLTLNSYLSATAGQRFSSPIEFEMVPLFYTDFIEAVEREDLDFVYANPGSYSCVGVEFGAHPLVTTVTKVFAHGERYDLDVFGGVIFTRADNDEINTLKDLKDKVIGAGSINVIMGGQAQLYTMMQAGMDYVMDPKKVAFTGDQFAVVDGVINGTFDVGMVRTDLIERYEDEDGVAIDPDFFKVLDPKIYVQDNGELFPFLHSTDIYPEWPLAALQHVPYDVSAEVQAALMAFGDHARPAEAYEQCVQEWCATNDCTTKNLSIPCEAAFSDAVTRCDTTRDLAELALQAGTAGFIAGFRTPTSYFRVRDMHQSGHFMVQNKKDKKWQCTRADTLYEALTCPPEHFKLSREDFDKSCEKNGVPCQEGNSCYCKPCVKHKEVSVFQYFESKLIFEGCEKMSVCATAEQTKPVTLHIIDNMEREGAAVTVISHFKRTTREIDVVEMVNRSFGYDLTLNETDLGVEVVEILVNGVQIPESPVRVEITPRRCDLDFPGASREPDEHGVCVCDKSTKEINGACVSTTVLAISASIAAFIGACVLGYIFIQYKQKMNDQVWHINVDELQFGDPVETIGEGAFGVVLLAEYRGTKVAVKRAVRPRRGGGAGNSRRSHGRSSLRGSVDGRSSVDYTSAAGSAAGGNSECDGSKYSANSIDLNSLHSHESREDSTNTRCTDVESRPGGKHGCINVDMESGSSAMRSGQGSVVSKNTRKSGSGSITGMLNRRKRSSLGGFDLEFLAERFGRTKTKKGWWSWGKDNYQEARFKEKVLGESGVLESRTFRSQIIPCFDKQRKQQQEFISEMRLLSRLRHPCITTVMGAVISSTHVPMLVMEFMENGSVFDLINNETMYLSGEIILQILRDVAQGLRYLHASKPPVLHGDLKAGNILVDNRFRAKVADFGLSKKKTDTLSGSLFWLAPEYLCKQTDYTAACDMYSMGIIVNELYSRKRPYEGEQVNIKQLLTDICDRKVNRRPKIPDTTPPRMKDLMKKLWAADPQVRPRAKELDMTLMDLTVADTEPLTQEQLNAKPRTEDMLFELFPRHIAEAIKAGKKIEPENHDLVTIVFSDIVGFTDISREISPMKVSMMLDRLYLAFDRIAKKHAVFKVETIGDAYMGTTNLVEKQENDHVKRIAEFAIDMIVEASHILVDDEEPEKGYINIRVGFHSGPVVSNVIGSMNPRYGLFGDTVNTASRMESNSVRNRILCSETSYNILKQQDPKFPVKKRGKIAVKGKGDMHTFWIGDELVKAAKRREKQMSTDILGDTGGAAAAGATADFFSLDDMPLEAKHVDEVEQQRVEAAPEPPATGNSDVVEEFHDDDGVEV